MLHDLFELKNLLCVHRPVAVIIVLERNGKTKGKLFDILVIGIRNCPDKLLQSVTGLLCKAAVFHHD